MKTDLFFQQFHTLVASPQGITRLRELILQLAVQGKLGTQDSSDEPSSELLKRVKKEKEKVTKERKFKRERPFEPIKDNEVNFRIPNNWILTRLGDIAQYNAETKTSAKDIPLDAWIFDLEDIEKDTSRILQKIRFKDRQSLSTKSKFQKGDVLYGKLRPYLNKVVVADEDGYCTTEIVPIRPYAKILSKYLMYALKTPDFLTYVNSKTYGIKMPRLGTIDALNTVIPLPPLSEQHRIVTKVDMLLVLCDQLEIQLRKRTIVQERFAEALIKDLPLEKTKLEWKYR
jgi:type I restriction enzyme, S subunit